MDGSPPVEVRISERPLDLAAELARATRAGPAAGAVVTFVGLMRDVNNGDAVAALTLEHYPGMTEKALRAIADEAVVRWDLLGVWIVHRVGEMTPGDPIVWVAVASAHRSAAFRAGEFVMDFLKTRAPFWKRERLCDGTERWVDARDSDQQAAAAWTGAGPEAG